MRYQPYNKPNREKAKTMTDHLNIRQYQYYAFIVSAILIVLVSLLSGCSTMKQFNAMSEQDKAEYIAFADKMTVDQRKEFLARGNHEGRMAYLQEIGLYDEFMGNNALVQLEDELKSDFLKAYLNMGPEEIEQMIAKYDVDTRDRIMDKDLQYGWSNKEVILSLGKPADILIRKADTDGEKRQLWIYKDPTVATYLYFNNGKLSNWAN
jgi:hypothetical protein